MTTHDNNNNNNSNKKIYILVNFFNFRNYLENSQTEKGKPRCETCSDELTIREGLFMVRADHKDHYQHVGIF